MSDRYLVMFEIGEGQWIYSSDEKPFTYYSKPLTFETKGEAEAHSLRYKASRVLLQSEVRPFDRHERQRAKVRAAINRGI